MDTKDVSLGQDFESCCIAIIWYLLEVTSAKSNLQT